MKYLIVVENSDAILNCIFGLARALSEFQEVELLVYGRSPTQPSLPGVKIHILQPAGSSRKEGILKKVYCKYFGKLTAGYLPKEEKQKLRQRILELQSGNHYDCLVTCSGTYDLHSLAFHNVFNKRVMYLVDPFCFNPVFSVLTRGKRLRTELQCMQQADVVFAPQIVWKDYARSQTFAPLMEKIHALELPLIYPRNSQALPTNRELPKDFGFFAGNLNNDCRKPQFLIDFFEACGLPLVIAGAIPRKYRRRIQKIPNILFLGHLPKAEVWGLIEQSGYLVNVGNSVDNMIPSKLFEYISSGKRILNFYKMDDCLSRDLLSHYDGICLNISENEPIPAAVEKLQEFLKEPTAPVSPEQILCNEAYSKYRPDSVARGFLKVVEAEV